MKRGTSCAEGGKDRLCKEVWDWRKSHDIDAKAGRSEGTALLRVLSPYPHRSVPLTNIKQIFADECPH